MTDMHAEGSAVADPDRTADGLVWRRGQSLAYLPKSIDGAWDQLTALVNEPMPLKASEQPAE
jgi:hypothetical protein